MCPSRTWNRDPVDDLQAEPTLVYSSTLSHIICPYVATFFRTTVMSSTVSKLMTEDMPLERYYFVASCEMRAMLFKWSVFEPQSAKTGCPSKQWCTPQNRKGTENTRTTFSAVLVSHTSLPPRRVTVTGARLSPPPRNVTRGWQPRAGSGE